MCIYDAVNGLWCAPPGAGREGPSACAAFEDKGSRGGSHGVAMIVRLWWFHVRHAAFYLNNDVTLKSCDMLNTIPGVTGMTSTVLFWNMKQGQRWQRKPVADDLWPAGAEESEFPSDCRNCITNSVTLDAEPILDIYFILSISQKLTWLNQLDLANSLLVGINDSYMYGSAGLRQQYVT